MLTYPISRAQAGAPLTAAQHDGNLRSGGGYPTTSEMLADETGWTEEDLLAAEGFRYRVAAPGAIDHHLTTAGGVKLKVLPNSDGFYRLEAFGAVADNATDIYDALWKAIYRTPEEVAKIDLGVGEYYCSKTLHLKKRVHLRGAFGGSQSAPALTTIRFPTETSGIILNHNRTYNHRSVYSFADLSTIQTDSTAPGNMFVGAYWLDEDTNTLYEVVENDAVTYDYETSGGIRILEIERSTIDAPDVEGKADSSRLEDFALSGTAVNTSLTTEERTSPDGGAHGIQSHVRIYMTGIAVRFFAGCGVMIYSDSGQLVANPASYGVASQSQIDKCLATRNGGNGWHFQGADANICLFKNLDAVANGRWGIWDRSFLGNIHIGHHIAFNGSGSPVWANPDNTGSRVFVDDGTVTYYEANDDATEQELVNTKPGTDHSVWVEAVENRGAVDTRMQPEWQPGQPVGTYFHGGCFKIFGASAAHVLISLYTELGQAAAVVKGPSTVVGSMYGAGFKLGGAFRAVNGNRIEAGSFETMAIAADTEAGGTAESGIQSALGGGSGAVFSATGLTGNPSGVYRFRSADGVDFRWDYQNSGRLNVFEITGQDTAMELGTGEAMPHHLVLRRVAIGPNGNSARRQTNDTAAPITGTWARGDIVWNRAPIANGVAGWMCVAAGTPGTWATIGLGALAE